LFLQRHAGREIGHSHGPGGSHHHDHTHPHDHHHAHAHAHDHPTLAHDQDHDHVFRIAHAQPHANVRASGAPRHSHGPLGQPEQAPVPATVSARQLLVLGITGGIVPCPAALVVLLSAVALHRVAFGLFLIVAFSLGLAAVLIAVGLLMIHARRYMDRFRGEGTVINYWLPLASATVITFLGLAIAIRSLVAGGIVQFRL
jgi:ABC-type nickel/cobalt efflux system permease component RcnA